MDIWSNRQMRSYIGLTAHFIRNWKLESIMLSCHRFKGRHTGENAYAMTTLGVPASSAPVERLFSIAGKVFKPDRCRLTDKTFETLMFIRCNSID